MYINSYIKEKPTTKKTCTNMNHKKEKIKIYQIVLKLKAYHEYGMYS